MWVTCPAAGPAVIQATVHPKHSPPGAVLLAMEIEKLSQTALIAFDATWPSRQRARNCRKAQSCLGHLGSMGRNICYPSPVHSCKPGVRTYSAFSFCCSLEVFLTIIVAPLDELEWSSLGETL